MECVVYHTVENRDNAADVEKNAPFRCVREDAWLGEGYYFWETFVELAHKWGKDSYNGNYFICKSSLNCCYNDILDLVGNTKQLQYMQCLIKEAESSFNKRLTANALITFIRSKVKFPYKVIRANGISSMGGDRNISKWKIKFNKNREAYLELMPAIQLCVIDKSILQMPLKIIYPEEYCEGYVI